jgi:hypothetical protein
MLSQFKNTPAMEGAIKERLNSVIWDEKLDGTDYADVVFAIFDMGRKGFKLEDINVEAVLDSIGSR